jgi:hypothetical protein
MTPANAAQLTGQPVIPSTTSLDLPSGLAKLLTMDTFNPAAPMTQPAGLMTSVSPAALAQTANNPMVPQYAAGGAVGPGGYPMPQAQPSPAPAPPDPYANYPIVANPVRSQWDRRADGSAKGDGWLGIRQRPDGRVSSEISAGFNIGGKEQDIPLMVPGLTAGEMQYLMTTPVDRVAHEMPQSIRDKAIAHANMRMAQGQSPFRQPDEPMAPQAPQVPQAPPTAPVQGLPGYQQGGAVGPGGAPLPPVSGAPPGASALGTGQVAQQMSQRPEVQQWQATPMDPAEAHGAIDQQLAQNPQAAQQIQGEIMKGLQSGELTPQELNMGIQLIEAAVNNPSLYPQLRQFAIQQGLGGEDDFPPQYDRGFVMLLLTVAKSAQQLMQGGANMQGMPGGGPQGMPGGGPQGMPPGAGPPGAGPPGAPPGMPMQSMAGGGNVAGRPNMPVPIMAHEGEYVVPKHVVGMKGREFFDKLVEKYSGQQT